jgi:UDP-N-acetylglucosamine 2-epimerase (non-hydrolysing)
MKKIKIAFVVGTRPEIIKMSPLIEYCLKKNLSYILIHTNQHYSEELDQYFFRDLNLPAAKYHLKTRSKSHSEQTGEMMIKLGKINDKELPSHLFIQGDTNSALAGALAAAKTGIQICHIESGLRSNDRQMPEEINRVIIDHIAEYLFCPTEVQAKILINESVHGKIVVTGNTIVDAVLGIEKIIREKSATETADEKYILMTMHRPSNVDNRKRLITQLQNISRVAQKFNLKVIFPIHPRTEKNLNSFGIKIPKNIEAIAPVGFIEMIGLEKNAKLIFTDSGGIQEEACILKIPCLILRENTERPECLEVGAAKLVGENFKKLEAFSESYLKKNDRYWENPFGDGRAAEKIINYILTDRDDE